MGAASVAAGPLIARAQSSAEGTGDASKAGGNYRLPVPLGLGGVAIGNLFFPTPERQAEETLEAAWKAGVRYFDTAPFYGAGLSEHRFGEFLRTQKREDFIVSTKIGRVYEADSLVKGEGWSAPGKLWADALPFSFKYDYTADGVWRSVEDSLQRLGLSSIDIVFVHDLSPDNGDFGERWTDQFDIAAKGAFLALTKMRDQGIIKAWGMGVNRIEPVLAALKAGDPDVMLSATQYSLMKHEDALERLFPACEERGVSIVVGAPLNAGFLAGVDRYDYGGTIPAGFLEKRARMSALAKEHGTDLRTAALQFSSAPSVVTAIIPGARSARQVTENVASGKAKIPDEFWAALKKEGLISMAAPTNKVRGY